MAVTQYDYVGRELKQGTNDANETYTPLIENYPPELIPGKTILVGHISLHRKWIVGIGRVGFPNNNNSADGMFRAGTVDMLYNWLMPRVLGPPHNRNDQSVFVRSSSSTYAGINASNSNCFKTRYNALENVSGFIYHGTVYRFGDSYSSRECYLYLIDLFALGSYRSAGTSGSWTIVGPGEATQGDGFYFDPSSVNHPYQVPAYVYTRGFLGVAGHTYTNQYFTNGYVMLKRSTNNGIAGGGAAIYGPPVYNGIRQVYGISGIGYGHRKDYRFIAEASYVETVTPVTSACIAGSPITYASTSVVIQGVLETIATPLGYELLFMLTEVVTSVSPGIVNSNGYADGTVTNVARAVINDIVGIPPSGLLYTKVLVNPALSLELEIQFNSSGDFTVFELRFVGKVTFVTSGNGWRAT